MEWKPLLASITGPVDQDLLWWNEYRVAEHRMLRKPSTGRVRLTEGERATLAELGKWLGENALAEVMSGVNPETVLWPGTESSSRDLRNSRKE